MITIMKRKLISEIKVSGLDIFGRDSEITFSPALLDGWFWNLGDFIVPINYLLIKGRLRRLSLEIDRRRELEIYEHIGVLRWTGLNGVVINSKRFPPYFGRASEMWEVLKRSAVPLDAEVSWVTVKREIKVGSSYRYLQILPQSKGRQPGLNIRVYINFPKLGSWTCETHLPMALALEDCLRARTLGWPQWLYHFSLLAPNFIWHHHKKVVWPQDYSTSEILNEIAMHRLADLLGALSLVSSRHLLAGEVISYCSGHELDILALKQIVHNLRLL